MLFGVWDSNLSHASTPLIFPGLFVFAVVNQPLCTLLGASAALFAAVFQYLGGLYQSIAYQVEVVVEGEGSPGITLLHCCLL